MSSASNSESLSASRRSLLKASESGSNYTHDPYAFPAIDAASIASGSDRDEAGGSFLVVPHRRRRLSTASASAGSLSNLDLHESRSAPEPSTPNRKSCSSARVMHPSTPTATRTHLSVAVPFAPRSRTPPHDGVFQRTGAGGPVARRFDPNEELPMGYRDISLSTWIAAVTPHPVRFHEEGLAAHCEFTEVPPYVPTPAHWPSIRLVESDGSTHRVFLGQVPFASTAEQVAFVLERVCRVVPVFVATHRCGCFVAHFFDTASCDAVVRFHKRIYFDRDGVWVAYTDAALQAMSAEVEAVSTGLRATELRQLRLPRGSMVIEHFTDADAGTPLRRREHPSTGIPGHEDSRAASP